MKNLWERGLTMADMREANATTYQIIRDFFDTAVGQGLDDGHNDPDNEVFINMYVSAFCLGMELALEDGEDAMEIRMKLQAVGKYTAHYTETIRECFGLGS